MGDITAEYNISKYLTSPDLLTNKKTNKTMANLETIFANTKLTENGDNAFKSTLNPLLDILFMSEYYQKHLNEVKIGTSNLEKLFAMFIRDPRNGLGRRDLGRELMYQAEVAASDVVRAGRYDDLYHNWESMSDEDFNELASFMYEACLVSELAKKWMPRYSSKNLMLARRFAKAFNMNKQQYGHFVKVSTVESKLSEKNVNAIEFEHVPSLAMIKYYNRFLRKPDTAKRFGEYLEDVKSGKKELKVSTTTVYDIYKNQEKIDADLFFDKIEKISGSWIPVVDTSGSMMDSNDSFGKAMSVGHYLAKCSTYAPDTVVSFSSRPQLIHFGDNTNNAVRTHNSFSDYINDSYYGKYVHYSDSQYGKEIASMYTGDCSNTDFGAVCSLLRNLDAKNAPDYIIVLSDMEFDYGSSMTKDGMMNTFKANGMNTKLIWWNFNSRNMTCPETDAYGNIFLSGYSPMLLKYLEAGFDGPAFLKNMLKEYLNKLKS